MGSYFGFKMALREGDTYSENTTSHAIFHCSYGGGYRSLNVIYRSNPRKVYVYIKNPTFSEADVYWQNAFEQLIQETDSVGKGLRRARNRIIIDSHAFLI